MRNNRWIKNIQNGEHLILGHCKLGQCAIALLLARAAAIPTGRRPTMSDQRIQAQRGALRHHAAGGTLQCSRGWRKPIAIQRGLRTSHKVEGAKKECGLSSMVRPLKTFSVPRHGNTP